MKIMARMLLCVSLLMLFAGCSDPRKKTLACQKKRCTKAKWKSSFSRNLCMGLCESRYYKSYSLSGLEGRCKKGDDIACLRAGSKAKRKGGWPAAMKYLEMGCEKKLAKVCGLMGKLISRGKKGVTKDKKKGLSIMEDACGMGDPTSCASPAMQYRRDAKYKKAVALFRKGCEGDAPASCGMLGTMYRDGKGLKKDIPMARKYLGKACTLGIKAACTGLRRLR